jgi:hypothetical protein
MVIKKKKPSLTINRNIPRVRDRWENLSSCNVSNSKERQQSLLGTYVIVFVKLTWKLKQLNNSNTSGGLQDYYISKCL